MTALPDATSSAGSPHTLTDWLRRSSDSDLIALLRRRPDLALPAPVDLATLASRASVRSSIARALDSLDAYTLRVLEVISSLGAGAAANEVQGWFATDEATAVDVAIERLREWLLIWGADEDLHPVGAVREVIGPYPAGLGRTAAELFSMVNDIALAPLSRRLGVPPATQPRSGSAVAQAVLSDLDQLLADCDDAELSILDRLAAGPPIGTLRNATTVRVDDSGFRAADPDQNASPARSLLNRGLLVPVDRDTVELPREIALRLRAYPAGDVRHEPAEIARTDRGTAVIDGGGSSAVMESVRLVEVLLNAMADDPPAQLRAGGLGVRDLRRLSRILDVTESVTGLLVEVAYESGLLSSTTHVDPSYLPTTEFDSWLRRATPARWVQLATAWLGMTRLPSLIGERDERDKTIAPLSSDVERHSAPGLRLQLLRLLAELPPGQAPTADADVLSRLSWLMPRRAATSRPLAASMLTEAATLGLTGYSAITGYTRALVDGAETGAVRAELNATDALTAALPEAVDEFLLQPDLTAVVPGPATADLQRELSLAADLESTGGASVYRISPTSLRRALDSGRSGSDLLQFFTGSSRTPVPQALQYMINDVASQHGRLRTGTAASYLRCDDEALLDRVMTDPIADTLNLQRIAPTVVLSSSTINVVLDRLRAAGFAPAAESATGAIVSLAADAPRVAGRPQSRVSRVRASSIPDAQLSEVVTRLRASERLSRAVTQSTNRVSQQIPGVTSASILEVLRAAIRAEQTIALGYVDDTGTPSQRTLLPISMGGGMVRGHDPDDERLRSYPLQRITTVSVLDDSDDSDDDLF
ncbi:helicase-associated domain-containing protein [Jatrophihabitans sp. DSM 45814]